MPTMSPRLASLVPGKAAQPVASNTAGIPRPVWFLGLTSLFTDAATEMIYPLLPVYLSRVLGASAVSLGIIEGVAEGVNSLLKVISGYWSDRVSRRRPIVIAGYALSSLARPFIAITRTWPQVLLIRALDRVGKGIRGAPRDVLLARFATPTTRGRIYGFHRAMDHTGAIVGPLVATVILFFAPERYRLLFALTAIPGLIAVALLFFVDEPPNLEPPPATNHGSRTACRPASSRCLACCWCLVSEIQRMRSCYCASRTRSADPPMFRSYGPRFTSSKRPSRRGVEDCPIASAANI